MKLSFFFISFFFAMPCFSISYEKETRCTGHIEKIISEGKVDMPFELYGGISFYNFAGHSSGPFEDDIYALFPHRDLLELSAMRKALSKSGRKILNNNDFKYIGIENATRPEKGRTIRIVSYDSGSSALTILLPAVFQRALEKGEIDSRTLWLESKVFYEGNRDGHYENSRLFNDGYYSLKSINLTQNSKDNPPIPSISSARLMHLIGHFGVKIAKKRSSGDLLDLKSRIDKNNIENYNTKISNWKVFAGGFSITFKTSYRIAIKESPKNLIEVWGRLFIPKEKISPSHRSDFDVEGVALRESGAVRVYKEGS